MSNAKKEEPKGALVKAPTAEIMETGYGQLIMDKKFQEMPDRILASQPLVARLKKDRHFYVTKQRKQNDAGEWVTEETYNFNYEGKQLIGGLAGCQPDSRVIERTPDSAYVEGWVDYRNPMGEVIRFSRQRVIEVAVERKAALTKAVNMKLNGLTSTYHKKPDEIAANKKRYEEINAKYMEIEDEDEQLKFLVKSLLEVADLQRINENMIQLRQTLVNVATSKAKSSAYTDFIKHTGNRVAYKGLSDDEILVPVINTIEIRKAMEAQGLTAVEVSNVESVDAEAEETEHLLQPKPEEQAVEAVIVTEGGQAVATQTGEVLDEQPTEEQEPTDEPPAEEPAQTAEESQKSEGDGAKPTREELVTEIAEIATRLKLGRDERVEVYKKTTGHDKLKDMSDQQLADLVTMLKDSEA